MTNGLYRGMDRATLDAAYNNTAAVGQEKRDRYMADWTARSKVLLEKPGVKRDLRYGTTPRNRLDFLPCGRPNAPTFAFIHGGYWQWSDKETYAFVAGGSLAHGINVALIEYTLAPAIKLSGIVAEVKQAVGWLGAHLGELGAAREGLIVGGHSAGGHLTAAVTGEPGVTAAVPISGLFDLEPIRLNYLNDAVRMDEAEARRNSPLFNLPGKAPPIVVAVGAAELPELIRQSADYHAAWTKTGLTGRYLPLAGHEHYSVLDELARPDGKLTQAIRDFLAGRR